LLGFRVLRSLEIKVSGFRGFKVSRIWRFQGFRGSRLLVFRISRVLRTIIAGFQRFKESWFKIDVSRLLGTKVLS
jgi:hypothetical protein